MKNIWFIDIGYVAWGNRPCWSRFRGRSAVPTSKHGTRMQKPNYYSFPSLYRYSYGLRVWLNGSWLYFIGDKGTSLQYHKAIFEKIMTKLSRDDTLISLKITKVTGIKEKSDKHSLANHMFGWRWWNCFQFSSFYHYARWTIFPNRNHNDCEPDSN